MDCWSRDPIAGDWPFPLSCKGCNGSKSLGRSAKAAQGWRPNPGCRDCRRHVVLVIRGVTQLACRLKTLGNPSRNWTLRATRSSDETRFPFDKRRSEPTTARRLVRGDPEVGGPFDFWPGSVELRPEACCPEGEPQAEPPATAKIPAALKKSRSAHAKRGKSEDEYRPPSVLRGLLSERERAASASAPPVRPVCRRRSSGQGSLAPRRQGLVGYRVPSGSCSVWLEILCRLACPVRVFCPCGARVGAGLRVIASFAGCPTAWRERSRFQGRAPGCVRYRDADNWSDGVTSGARGGSARVRGGYSSARRRDCRGA